ncbi:MAG: ATP--guanido phosphotransferase [Clostridia bacterium]|nr:ATP--guanido phosphotransferase [Clostridia bacterium]
MVKDIDVVLSSRIRFARNIKDYPFAANIDEQSCREIIEKVEAVLGDFHKTDFTDIDPVTAQTYVENHSVSPEFAVSPLPRTLLEKGDTKVMVCEEDHIRLQVIKKGFSLNEAFAEACGTDDIILSKLRIAYDNELGFLTHCPTNLGSGMRASVMMFLPGLGMTGELKGIVAQLSKLGYTIRGIYGEGSDTKGHIYQISNAETMGMTEEATVSRLCDIVTQIIGHERNARERIKAQGIRNRDAVCRALGILKYACTMTSKEFIELYSKVRLGVALEIIDETDYETLDALFTSVMPATISLGQKLTEAERDIKRAEIIKEKLRRGDK